MLLPCKCGTQRVVLKDVLCPRCNSIKIVDPKPRIHEAEQELSQLGVSLQQVLSRACPEETVEALIIERERAAQACLTRPTLEKGKLKRWLAICSLISRYPWEGKGAPTSSLIHTLVTLSEAILEHENDIFRLKNGLAQIVIVGDSEALVSTESDVLSLIPDNVFKQYLQQLNFGSTRIDKKVGETMMLEFKGIKEILIQPGLPYVVGDELYRELKRIHSHRILPFISPSNTSMFIKICLSIAGFLAFLLGSDFGDKEGILRINSSKLEQYKSVLANEFGGQNVKWYFENVGISDRTRPLGLGSTIIVTTSKGVVFLPYFSIFLLIYLCLRWEKNPEKGELLRYVGKSIEDVIFSYIRGFDLNIDHPIHKKPLLRVLHPERNEEIADVMGYNDHYLVVIESKFREALTISSIDIELNKFLKKLNYIKNNLAKFGFPETLKTKSFFYTPFPPYTEWNDIKLVPSLVLLGVEFSRFFGVRPIKLLPRYESLRQLLESVADPTPFPIDISSLDQSISPDAYRVHDGIVEDYNENEVTVLTNNPIGMPTPLIVDINKDLYEEFKTKGVGKGDIIKMALFNLNKAWSQIQLVDFKLIKAYKLPRDKLDSYGLLSVLKLHSKEHELEKFAHQTWGKKLGDEILAVSKKWSIDLAKFVENQIRKGQNVLVGIGKVLGLADIFDVLAQCECGEVMGIKSDFVGVLQALYLDGSIRCSRCDPMQTKRLRKLGHKVLPFDESALFEYSLERSAYEDQNAESE